MKLQLIQELQRNYRDCGETTVTAETLLLLQKMQSNDSYCSDCRGTTVTTVAAEKLH